MIDIFRCHTALSKFRTASDGHISTVIQYILNYRTYMPITCRPEFTEGGVTAKDIYHPLLKEAVVNPVNWQKNTLVTGSNSSGKSTYVKSIALTMDDRYLSLSHRPQ